MGKATGKELVDLEEAGGEVSWTEEGLTFFIPQCLIGDWPAADLRWDEAEDRVIIQRAAS